MRPVDLENCMAEVPNGHTFMPLGGRPGRVRCTRAPDVVAIEIEPGADGQCGAMSLCVRCLTVVSAQDRDLWARVRLVAADRYTP